MDGAALSPSARAGQLPSTPLRASPIRMRVKTPAAKQRERIAPAAGVAGPQLGQLELPGPVDRVASARRRAPAPR